MARSKILETPNPAAAHRPRRRLVHLATEVASTPNYDRDLLGQLTSRLHPRVITPAMQLPYKPPQKEQP